MILLVVYHAFAPYCGAWIMPKGIDDVDIYKWISHFAFSFLLEGFIFISGYIFTFQLFQKNKFVSVWDLAKSKTERLLLPCVIFGAIYYILFFEKQNLLNTVYQIINGIAHLWYLPCLFWLFVFQYIIIKHTSESTRRNKCIVALCIGIIPIVSIVDIPFQLGRTAYYLMFFYGGGLFYQYSKKIASRCKINKVCLLWGLFVIAVISLYIVMEGNKQQIEICTSRYAKLPYYIANVYLKIIIAWIGITALYMTAVLYCKEHKVIDSVIKIGTYGYGVYIFHQFILIFLYRETSVPDLLGTYYLPWISFIFTIILSLVITHFVRKTALGRKYL